MIVFDRLVEVKSFSVVQIDHDHRGTLLLPARSLEFHGQDLHEDAPVGDPGQAVHDR